MRISKDFAANRNPPKLPTIITTTDNADLAGAVTDNGSTEQGKAEVVSSAVPVFPPGSYPPEVDTFFRDPGMRVPGGLGSWVFLPAQAPNPPQPVSSATYQVK